MASHPRRVESRSVNFVTSFPRKGSPINDGNFYFRMKLYWRFLGTWACFHCADVLKWADIFMIWLQTLSCTWSSIWRLVQLSDRCFSSWTDWLFQHKNHHSSLYWQDTQYLLFCLDSCEISQCTKCHNISQVYWHCTTATALMSLSKRCQYLQKLDLSWCGDYGLITSEDLVMWVSKTVVCLVQTAVIIQVQTCKWYQPYLLTFIYISFVWRLHYLAKCLESLM